MRRFRLGPVRRFGDGPLDLEHTAGLYLDLRNVPRGIDWELVDGGVDRILSDETLKRLASEAAGAGRQINVGRRPITGRFDPQRVMAMSLPRRQGHVRATLPSGFGPPRAPKVCVGPRPRAD
jgi:hypothetical protein